MRTLCPRCYGCIIVDRDLAIGISIERLTNLYNLFLRYVRQFKKTRLIAFIVWEREKYSRSYFENFEPFRLSMFVSFSYLIKCLMIEDFDGNMEANEQNTPAIVELFSDYLGLLTEHIYLKEEFAELVATEPFEVSSLTMKDKQRKFLLIYNENYVPLLRTFANNEIYPEDEGKKKADDYREEWEKIRAGFEKKRKQVNYNPRSMITNSYPVVNALYCGLLKNVVFANTFDFSNYEGIVREPIQITELAKGYRAVRDRITITPVASFKDAIRQVFKSKKVEAESILLFAANNTGTFPLFPLLEGNVFISHTTTFIIFLLLHPILLKNVYDDETKRRSKQLEIKKTKEAFERAGFRYLSNVTDRKNSRLEIDGLAGKNGALLVVEVKGWGLTPFYEHKSKHEYLKRDLEGIVDGLKYTKKEGKKIPSLLDKIQYISDNMEKHGFDPAKFKEVKGIIVIEDYPPMEEYRGVKIIGLQDIPKI